VRRICSLVVAARAIHDAIVHLTRLSALDRVDVVSAFTADVPKTAALATSLSDWPGNSTEQFQAVKDRLAGFLAKGQLAIFTNGYWRHDSTGTRFDLPGGTIFNGDPKSVTAISSLEDPCFQANVSECIAHAWDDGDWTRHPYTEDTVPHDTESTPDGKCSWIKAPRCDGHSMQVGPLAQVVVVGQGAPC
jgi:Ni,Fe-hydrogenase I large subunit